MAFYYRWVRTEELPVEKADFDLPQTRWPIRARLASAVRSLLLVAVVFAATTVAGGLLIDAAAPATPAEPTTAQVHGGQPERLTVTSGTEAAQADLSFARSLIVTGAAGLLVAIAGMVLVARRRRAW